MRKKSVADYQTPDNPEAPEEIEELAVGAVEDPDRGERLLNVPLDLIDPDSDNERSKEILLDAKSGVDTDLEALKLSILSDGLKQRLYLFAKSDGRYLLSSGHRRWAAIMALVSEGKLNWATAPSIVAPMPQDKRRRDFDRLISNNLRAATNPVAEARTIKEILETHVGDEPPYTQQQAADKLGKSQPWIAGRLALLSLPQEVQTSIINGALSLSHAAILLKIHDWPIHPDGMKLAQSPDDVQAQFARDSIRNNWSIRQLDEAVQAHLKQQELYRRNLAATEHERKQAEEERRIQAEQQTLRATPTPPIEREITPVPKIQPTPDAVMASADESKTEQEILEGQVHSAPPQNPQVQPNSLRHVESAAVPSLPTAPPASAPKQLELVPITPAAPTVVRREALQAPTPMVATGGSAAETLPMLKPIKAKSFEESAVEITVKWKPEDDSPDGREFEGFGNAAGYWVVENGRAVDAAEAYARVTTKLQAKFA